MSTSPADTPWLDPAQQRSWRLLLGGTTVLFDRLDRDLRQAHGLSLAEYEILVRLSESPEHSVRMSELADALSHSRSRVTHTVSRLEKAGIVRRGQCGEDGRGVWCFLTDHGMRTLEQAAHTHVRGVHDYLVAQASADDFEAMGRVMQAVVNRVAEGDRCYGAPSNPADSLASPATA
jgi:DNA-binding MarR family transcriptional regulator